MVKDPLKYSYSGKQDRTVEFALQYWRTLKSVIHEQLSSWCVCMHIHLCLVGGRPTFICFIEICFERKIKFSEHITFQ